MHPMREDRAGVREAESQRVQAIGDLWRGNEINMAKLENDLLNFLLPKTQPRGLQFFASFLRTPASFSVLY